MLKRLLQFSVDNAVLVIIVAALTLGFAIYQVPKMPVDVFPELNAPTVTIMTESPGYAADEVEQYITFPVETSVNGLPGVRRVRSASAIGLSIVWVEFDWGVDIYRARYLVSEQLNIAEERLPPDVHMQLTPVSSVTGEIMLLSLRSPDGSPKRGWEALGACPLRYWEPGGSLEHGTLLKQPGYPENGPCHRPRGLVVHRMPCEVSDVGGGGGTTGACCGA